MRKKLKFEEALDRIEEIIADMETGIDDLDRIVGLFEEGSHLISFCQKKIDDAETRIFQASQKKDLSRGTKKQNDL
ncbi:MAG: exodeoxyribonuclease VII small subunit [Candidatus Cloacimonetes bacterium]|nr:exodeoxyribonuclease VII small subunit [Candidatus Cloacimonadota bacterium]